MNNFKDISELKDFVHSCSMCSLKKYARLPVPGAGSFKKRIMLIGEAPGKEEDIQNAPFVGPAGQLLTKALTKLAINREDIYITNIVKCRPQNNQTPSDEHIQICKTILEKEINLIQPEVIICLGKTATNGLLGTKYSIQSVRGKILYYKNIPVIPTYHPAFLLRNQSKICKLQFFEDLKKGIKMYDIIHDHNLIQVLSIFDGTISDIMFVDF